MPWCWWNKASQSDMNAISVRAEVALFDNTQHVVRYFIDESCAEMHTLR